jgi:hypothetical protein
MLRIGGIGKRERCRAGLGRERTVQIPGGPQRQTPSGTRLLCCPGYCWLLVGGENRTHHLGTSKHDASDQQQEAANCGARGRIGVRLGQPSAASVTEREPSTRVHGRRGRTRGCIPTVAGSGRKWQEVAGAACFPAFPAVCLHDVGPVSCLLASDSV